MADRTRTDASRTQRKALQNQVLNGAREAVVRGIRRYQDWLSDVIGFSEQLGWAFDAEQSGTPQDWKRIAEEAMDLFYKRADVMVELIYVLEEYEIVFPATRDVRNYLQNVPYDRRYEPVFIGLVAALLSLGCKPRCKLEIRDRGEGRPTRIFEILEVNPFSHAAA